MATQPIIPPRHRPTPLSSNPSGGMDHRSNLLSSLRTARPIMQQQQQQQQYTPNPQDYQSAMFDLQQQILLQQSQIILATQEREAQQAIMAMRGMYQQQGPSQGQGFDPRRASGGDYYRQHPQSAFVHGSFPHAQMAPQQPQQQAFVSPEDEASVMRNPLAASALARRKRQSLNMEAVSNPPPSTGRRISLQHHRRSSSSTSTTFSTNLSSYSSNRSSPTSTEPPALILSKPGDPFPVSTSGSESDSSSAHSKNWRRPGIERNDSNDSSNLSAEGEEPVHKLPERRQSQASTLAAALSTAGRRQRPASMGAPPPHLQLGAEQPRSVSDQSALSPFATTFQPLPPSPFTPTPTYQPARPQAQVVPGTASAIRQPKGPAQESEFEKANFSTRLRRKAIQTLLRGNGELGIGRLSLEG